MVFAFFGFMLIFAVGLLISWIITQPLLVTPTPTAAKVSISPARLERHVSMLSKTFMTRNATHPENLDRIAAYVAQEFAEANARVVEQPYAIDGHTYRNVIGAHYHATEEFPGADDNASGVAGLIELAYLVGTVPLPMGVELVAYTLEEPPSFRTTMMGSAVHARSLKQQGQPVRVMIALEMNG